MSRCFEARPGDYASAFLNHYWTRFWVPRRLLARVIVQLAVILLVDEVFEIGSWRFVAWATSLSLLIALLGNVIFARLAGRTAYKQHAALCANMTIAADAQALSIETEHTRSTIPWSSFRCWRESPRAVLLYQTDTLFHVIPKRLLGEEQLRTLRIFAGAAGLPGAA